MYKKIRIFEYFKISLEDALFGVNEILSDENHPEHKNLKLDIDDLIPSEVEQFITSRGFERFLRENEDLYIQKCVIYLIETIQKGIAREKLKEMQKVGKLGAPYNSENLTLLEIEENNLVSIKNLKISFSGFIYNDNPLGEIKLIDF